MTQRPSQPNLVALLEQQVLPRLFERLDQAFPEFGWERTPDGWVATTRETTKHVLNARPERVVCNRPYGFYAHGGEARTWVAYVSGEAQPRGSRFVAAVERLCELAGLPSPGRAHSPQEAEALAQAEARREVLARATQLAQNVLRGAEGAQARAYAERRGLSLEAQEELAVGLWPSVGEVRRAIPTELHAAAQDAGLFREQFAGYLVVPWLDAWGRPLTLYFRWPGSELPQGLPKTQALPGAGTKSSPLYYDRAKHAGHSDLVLVEGVFDAAVLQARGETQVVACVAAQLSKAQVETLERNRVDSVTLVLDPDPGGEAGTRSCLKSLAAAGIQAYVAPTLPDGLDPNEYVLRDGVDGWRAHLRGALTGPCYLAQRALQGVQPESPRPEREAALRRVGEVIEQLQGRTAARERAELVRITAKATGFAASHLKAELPPASGERPARAPGAAAEAFLPLDVPYREDPSGLVWVRERFDKDGRPAYDDVPLANFCARITAEITEDDGAEERRVFEVTAQLHGATQVVQVPALQFQGLQWVLGQLGASATLEPGKALQDRVRHGIQVLSGIPPSERVYTHLGWRELEDGWAFLHAEGAIGADGAQEDVRIKVGDPLERFALPAPPEGAELEKALAACLSFLQLAPERLTVPLLALPFRAALGEADFTAFLYGSSGGHKSCLAALVQQFFGQGLHYQNLPGSWLSSANALEGTLFLAKDTVFVIDDFVPAGSVSDRARRHRDA
ncbi:MAG: toprim domain-containing protein, partial [Planctomycetota bacterium]